MTTCRVGFKNLPEFIPYTPKNSKLLLITSDGIGRILKAPMMAVDLAGKYRASLISITANGNDGFHLLLQKLLEGLGAMVGNIDSNLLHHLNGLGVDIARRF